MSSVVAMATILTARSKAASLSRLTFWTPLTLRTYCRAAASISSEVAIGSSPRRVVMLRHMSRTVPPAVSGRPGANRVGAMTTDITIDITIDTAEGPMPALLGTPTNPPRGGIVVVQEAFGLTPHIGAVCDRLAGAGWLAVAPALFHRTGSPVLGYGDFDALAPHFMAITAEGIGTDLSAALGVLDDAGLSARQRGVVGFCMGGTLAFWAATTFQLGAAVTFYGGGVATGRFGLPSMLEMAGQLDAPWQGHFGDLDEGIPIDQVEALRAALADAHVPTELHRYADAGHGFNCDDRDAFHEPSATEAWARTLAWFDAHLPD